MDEEKKDGQTVENVPTVDAQEIGSNFLPDETFSSRQEDAFAEPDNNNQKPAEKNISGHSQPTANDSPTDSVAEGFSVDESLVPQSNTNEVSAIDRSAQQNAIDSDKDYRRITEKIIDKTCEQLKQHTDAKTPLRKKLSNFIIFLLLFQFLVLEGILFFNRKWNLQITDFIINVYIISVFLETLAGLIIMIKFAFDSQQEVELIKILNAIIINFKKYDEK